MEAHSSTIAATVEGNEPRNWLSVRQFADAMGLNIHTVYDLCKTSELPHIRVGGTIRIHTNTLEAWLAAQELATA